MPLHHWLAIGAHKQSTSPCQSRGNPSQGTHCEGTQLALLLGKGCWIGGDGETQTHFLTFALHHSVCKHAPKGLQLLAFGNWALSNAKQPVLQPGNVGVVLQPNSPNSLRMQHGYMPGSQTMPSEPHGKLGIPDRLYWENVLRPKLVHVQISDDPSPRQFLQQMFQFVVNGTQPYARELMPSVRCSLV